MSIKFLAHLNLELASLKDAGLYKSERVIASRQAGTVALESGREVINLCANNYLGLSDNPELIKSGQDALGRYGYGMSSVRFICGTQEEHTELERRISEFLGFEDTILYSSCFDANAGLFETLLGPEDAIISDALLAIDRNRRRPCVRGNASRCPSVGRGARLSPLTYQ